MFKNRPFPSSLSVTLVASLGAQTLSFDPIVVSAIKTEQTLKNTTSNCANHHVRRTGRKAYHFRSGRFTLYRQYPCRSKWWVRTAKLLFPARI